MLPIVLERAHILWYLSLIRCKLHWVFGLIKNPPFSFTNPINISWIWIPLFWLMTSPHMSNLPFVIVWNYMSIDVMKCSCVITLICCLFLGTRMETWYVKQLRTRSSNAIKGFVYVFSIGDKWTLLLLCYAIMRIQNLLGNLRKKLLNFRSEKA